MSTERHPLVQNDQERHGRKRGILYKWLGRPILLSTNDFTDHG